MKKYLESIVFKLCNIISENTVASLFNIRSKVLHSNTESLCCISMHNGQSIKLKKKNPSGSPT